MAKTHMRYRLATYRECKAHREWNTTCPDCGRRGKFSPYIDTTTMRPVDDRTCGRCNRLSNCGYHLPPRMVASPNFARKRDSLVPINRQSSQPTLFRVGPKRGLADIAEPVLLPQGGGWEGALLPSTGHTACASMASRRNWWCRNVYLGNI